jgi:hypothetical protein
VALAAIADDGDLLALDQVQVGVAIVINTHGRSSWLGGRSARITMSSEYFRGVRPVQRAGSAGDFGALSSPFLA